jgi:hypothetical protein
MGPCVRDIHVAVRHDVLIRPRLIYFKPGLIVCSDVALLARQTVSPWINHMSHAVIYCKKYPTPIVVIFEILTNRISRFRITLLPAYAKYEPFDLKLW